MLSEFALDNPQLFRGKRVLELGAGIGLTSVMLATFTGLAAITATDFDVRALENIHHNFINSKLERERKHGWMEAAVFNCRVARSDFALLRAWLMSCVALRYVALCCVASRWPLAPGLRVHQARRFESRCLHLL